MRARLCPLLPLLAALACAGAPKKAQPDANAKQPAGPSRPNATPSPARTAPANPPAQSAGSSAHPRQPALPTLGCPEGMQLLTRPQGAYCIDRYEASLVTRGQPHRPWPGNQKIDSKQDTLLAVSVAGVKPQGYISGDQAARVCDNAGKRLCEMDEWVRACRGPERTLYPYGNQRLANVCNDRYKKLDRHPVVRLFSKKAAPGASPNMMWHPSWMNDPALHVMPHSVSKTGEFFNCKNAYEVYDMVGNLHEWVADDNGTFVGGFFMDTFQNGEGCEYRTLAHPVDYHDYSTGFRCCSEPSTLPGATSKHAAALKARE